MEVIIAIIGTATTVITVTLTNFFAKRNQLRLEERKLKEEYYVAFIKAVSDSVVSEHSEISRDNLADCQNKLLLVSSSDVVKALMNFNNYIKPPCENFSAEHHDSLLTDLIKAIRKDLFSYKSINKNYPTIHLTGKSPRNR